MLEAGITGKSEITVEESLSAKAVGSGLVDVYATPSMIGLMEKTAAESVAPYLEEGCGTVGTKINVAHTAATPIGMKVTCRTKLVQVDKKRLVFEVEASDECGKIGEGTHERFIIVTEKFQQKADSKGK